MPRRMIDGGLATSASLNHVSMEAALTFLLVVSLCDDFGRYDGRLEVLHSHLYPLRKKVTVARLAIWLGELDAEGCIHFYEVEGKPLVHLPRWDRYQRLRQSRAKWPEPDGNCTACRSSPQVAADRRRSPPEVEARSEKREARSENVSRGVLQTPLWALDNAALLMDLLKPVPGARIPHGARHRWAAEIVRLVGEVSELKELPDDDARRDHVETAIRWALGPENLGVEYEVVIRSGKSLREKWPKLVAAAQRARRSTGPKEEMAAWMNSET